MENVNTSMLELKRLDCFLSFSKNKDIPNNEKDFSNYLKKSKMDISKTNKENRMFKKTKLEKTEEKKEVSKLKTIKDKNNTIQDEEYDEDNEEIFEELEYANIQIQDLIINLIAFFNKDEEVSFEEIEGECIEILQELESTVLLMKDEYKNSVNIELTEDDIKLLQNVVNNLNELKELLVDSKKNFGNLLDKNLISQIEKQVIGFEQKLKVVTNKVVTKETMNELILNIDNQNNQKVREKLDNNNIIPYDEDTIEKTNEIPTIKEEGKTEIADDKLGDRQFDMNEFTEERITIHTKPEQAFESKVNKIQSKEIQIPKDEVLKQIIDKGKAIISNEKSEVRIKLKPEILGELVLKIELEKGVVVAKALVDNYRVKELLETNVFQLKEGLEEQGVEIKTFEVQVGSNSDFEKQNRQRAFNNGKKKKIKIKKLDLDDLNLYEENTISYKPSIESESTLDLMA